MVIVDDHLVLLVLAGAVADDEFSDDVATTSLWYLRLVAAVTSPPVAGRGPGWLTRMLDVLPADDRAAAIARILDPSREVIEVLHPMRYAVETARAQREQHLNLLAAETIGAAIHHEASILVAAPNAGGPIQHAAQERGIVYRVRTQ